jgi:uncharacterized membrane protein
MDVTTAIIFNLFSSGSPRNQKTHQDWGKMSIEIMAHLNCQKMIWRSAKVMLIPVQGCCVSVCTVLLQVAASPVQILQKLLSCSYCIHLPASLPKDREDYKNRMWGQGN